MDDDDLQTTAQRLAGVVFLLVVVLAIAALLCSCCSRSQLIIEPMEGKGFAISVEAALLARELTDEEIDGADDGTGCGFSNSRNAGEDAVWMREV